MAYCLDFRTTVSYSAVETADIGSTYFQPLSGAANGRPTDRIGLGRVVLSSIFSPRHQSHQQLVATTWLGWSCSVDWRKQGWQYLSKNINSNSC